jgi:Na+/H+ antiporter NhaC
MDFGILSLIPALVTILAALLTRRVALSLFLGVIAGAFVVAEYNIPGFFEHSFQYLKTAFTDLERLKIVLFVVLIGGLLEIIAGSGAYNKFADTLKHKLNTPRKSRVATWGISMCLFFDDYANVLISGAAMRRINMKNNVTPAQLAYLVDVVAIMASIMIVSTWASFEGSVMAEAGKEVGMQGTITEFFIQALPYHFYTFLAIIMALMVAYTGKWFGYKADNQTYQMNHSSEVHNSKSKLYHLLAPILTLLGFAVLALFASGSFILIREGKPVTLINILGSAPSVEILIIATILAIAVGITLVRKDHILTFPKIFQRFGKGTKGMVGVSLVIILAKGLSEVSAELGTGIFITDSISDYITLDVLPMLIFIVSMLITVATGFSWSSMAIVMPIAFQMVMAEQAPEMIPVISAAVISGAVSGEHVIPFSEKAVMSAAACKIEPIYHIKTMIFQTLVVFIAASGSYLLIGITGSWILSFLAPLSILLLVHFVFGKTNQASKIEE